MIDVEELRSRLRETHERLADAAPGEPPELLVATKYVAPDEMPALAEAGVTLVGENRMQDLREKLRYSDRLTFDFIGHLQRRKVKDVIPQVRLFHALDSVRLAEEIARRAEGGPTRVLVEVNLAEEESKGGIVPGRLDEFVEQVSAFPEVVIGGLMGMPPAAEEPERSRPHFVALRGLRDRLAARFEGRHDFRELSMGTSQDHIVAAEEGATIVRVGRGLVAPARTAG
jgi:pyridoxal phosphate enzyme (YggS family)